MGEFLERSETGRSCPASMMLAHARNGEKVELTVRSCQAKSHYMMPIHKNMHHMLHHDHCCIGHHLPFGDGASHEFLCTRVPEKARRPTSTSSLQHMMLHIDNVHHVV